MKYVILFLYLKNKKKFFYVFECVLSDNFLLKITNDR